MKNLTLVILDGFGINAESPAKNALSKANAPTFAKLFSESSAELGASGLAVGVPEGQMGNSEIGHLTIGGGRILAQSIVKIDELLKTGEFDAIPGFRKVLDKAENNGRIHLMGLLGPGGVHAHTGHLSGIVKLVPEGMKINLHVFADGRDTDPKSFYGYLESFLAEFGGRVTVASISGRYFAMDRDTNWGRTEKAFKAIVGAIPATNETPLEYVKKNYKNGITDEFLEPARFPGADPFEENETLAFFNFRSDRAKQLAKAFTDRSFDGFETNLPEGIEFATMTRYYPEFSGTVFLEDDATSDFLGEVLEKRGIRQLHVAETEKFAHVTKFFNGGRGTPFEGETDFLVPSHKVATYDLDPAMSAEEILEAYLKNESEYPFAVVNFANGDMVGHTGMMDAAAKAVETLDSVMGRLIAHSAETGRELLVTADHGNMEDMGTADAPMTAHTCNPVPFWHIRNGETLQTKPTGGLSDIAPTVLDLLGIPKPEAMTGSSLVATD